MNIPYRAYAQALHEYGGLPQMAVALLFLHYYIVVGNERGVLYEVVAARKWGALRREVLDTIEYTFLECGPFGINAVAAMSSDYLEHWPEDALWLVQGEWPAEWMRVPRREVKLRNRLLEDHAPSVWSAMNARITYTKERSTLPEALLSLFHLHTAVARGEVAHAGQLARRALEYGVALEQLLEVVGFGALYGTEFGLTEVCDEISRSLSEST